MESESLQKHAVYTQEVDKTASRMLFRNVYLWMTLALIMTALTSYVVVNSPILLNAIFTNKMVFYGLIIGEFAIVWYLSARITRLSFFSATVWFVIYSVLNGATLSFVFLLYTASSIAITFVVTAGMFATMALIGTFLKKDLSSWGNILLMALIGLVIASVVNIFWANSTLYWITTYAGVLIFTGLTVYDAQRIKKSIQAHGSQINETTQKIALMGALSLYLDFINLFLYMLRILGGRR
ncbi:FtsH-binding integral membrane protein [Dysgonomonas sp. PH5-45]|uniref:Bax inhibitor-1/YccA family protein n=1 Tax=unclassified Dysgonomonas TaxID=2630389 RepID=UPI002476DF17|nr:MULTISPECIES: Bax inhibitor-1/YccA family protein [unclassified Dysgonomonas]MDH6354751.1 FtsH-binding integral membrane protein [Dysgonomonas sp. PH5-45]MDH6387650.1 FtsH-binding integral membrane protein [Dysgonomonas sp. PH5-37]